MGWELTREERDYLEYRRTNISEIEAADEAAKAGAQAQAKKLVEQLKPHIDFINGQAHAENLSRAWGEFYDGIWQELRRQVGLKEDT